jgi:cysteine desulfurase
MKPFFNEHYSNPSSEDSFGLKVSSIITENRINIAKFINAESSEIFFTSGATESINIAIKGAARKKKLTIALSPIEHSAVIKTCKYLEKNGHTIKYLNIDNKGNIDYQYLEELMRNGIDLLCLMHVNNEIGIIYDLDRIGDLCKSNKTIFFVDAAQSFGKLKIDVSNMNIDMLVASGHKIYAPKGVGILYLNKKVRHRIEPLIHGGGQESGLRSGTLNVPSIVGLAKAVELCKDEYISDNEKIGFLTDHLYSLLNSNIPHIKLNGDSKNRIAGNLNLCIPKISGELLVRKLSNLCISTGSACNSTHGGVSHVLTALGLTREEVASSIRISIGRFNTLEEIEMASKELIKVIKKIQSL